MKKILVIWPTYRKDWLSTFEPLKDHFHLTFIPGTFPSEPNYAASYTCRYWSEFTSTQDILNQTQPDALIFMSIESGLSMALNVEAQKRGIKTLILQHGIFTNYKDYRNREKLWRKQSRAKDIQTTQKKQGFSTLQFLKNSFHGLDVLKIIPIALYTQLQQRIGPTWVSKWLPLRLKRANHYLCYSPYNATIHRETDRVKEEQITYIGSPELMQYLEQADDLIEERFYLHIDQALAENAFGEETLDKADMINFYQKLNTFCLKHDAKLYVKLHPESYAAEWLPDDPNMVFLRQVDDFNRYVQSALGCFGFYSTMVVAAVLWQPTILFHIQYSGLQEALEKIGDISVLPFHTFKTADIEFQKKPETSRVIEEFIRPKGVEEGALLKVFEDI